MKKTRFSRLAAVSDEVAFTRLIPTETLQHFGFTELPQPSRIWRNRAKTVETRKYKSGSGCEILVQRDKWELLITATLNGKLLFRLGLRDRSLDGGGPRGRKNPLNQFAVTHELANALPHRNFRAAELSVYSYELEEQSPSKELEQFVINPDKLIFPWHRFDPKVFFPIWETAFNSGLAPWQQRHPIKGLAPHFVEAACNLLQELGYNRVEAVPGWYNAALFFEKRMGFHYLNLEHELTARALDQQLSACELRLGTKLSTWQKAWVVALQNVPATYLTGSYSKYWLGGAHWTNSPTSSDYCARLGLDLNPFVATDIP